MLETPVAGEIKFDGGATLTRSFTTKAGPGTSIDVANRLATFLATPESVDAEGDVLLAKGCKLDRFLLNPSISVLHNGGFPIGVAKSVTPVPGEGVYVTIEFTSLDLPDTNPQKAYCEAVWAMVKAGTLKGISVEFRPLRATRDKMYEGQTGQCFLEWEVIDYSLVPKPCNAKALVKSLKEDPTSTELVFPEDVRSLKADEAPNTEDERLRDAVRRCEKACASLVDSDNTKALAGALHNVVCYLQHEQKGYTESIDSAKANAALCRDLVSKDLATKIDKSYSVCLLVGDDAISNGVVEEVATLGKLIGVEFVDDANLSDSLYPAEEEGDDLEQEGCGRRKPKDEESCGPKRERKKSDETVIEKADSQESIKSSDDDAARDQSSSLDVDNLNATLSAKDEEIFNLKVEKRKLEILLEQSRDQA